MKQTRKIRIYYVEPTSVLELFTSWNRTDYVALPKFKGIPDDSIVLSCVYSWESQAFYFMITHDSFDEVPKGEPAPKYEGEYEVVFVDKRDRRKGKYYG